MSLIDELRSSRLRVLSKAARRVYARTRLAVGLRPLSERWGSDRGTSVHRHYIDAYLSRHAADVHGRVLEFNDRLYTEAIGGRRVTKSDVLHIDDANPLATIVADLSRPNDVPSDTFDCIVCTHVLHVVFDLPAMIKELHRILKPGGTLLVAVPTISMIGPEFPELWRFTPLAVERLLGLAFQNVEVEGFGNSLAAAAEIRGVVSSELTRAEIDARDSRFTLEVCARAVK